MKKSIVTCVTALVLASPCRAAEFKATGNTDPDHQAKPYRTEVTVTFDSLPTKLCFNTPGFVSFVLENGMNGNNGWAETYDASAGVGSCEPPFDKENRYSRMWIKSANDARIVIRWRAALTSEDGIIAHRNERQVSPWGPGDWSEETFTVYPDGVYARHVTVHTVFAATARPFGWNRKPPNYIFETQEMIVSGSNDRQRPDDVIEKEALTLIKMDGTHGAIDYGPPYPVKHGPRERELFSSFGEFSDANMFVVNMKSKYRPFTIGRTEGTTISPYAPEIPNLPGRFQTWPHDPAPGEGWAVGLCHIVTRKWYSQTPTTISQVYLSGFTKSREPHTEIVPLARSWLRAPEVEVQSGCKPVTYDMAQRAFVVDALKSSMRFTVKASKERPVVNPCFVIKNWNSNSKPRISISGRSGKACRRGLERTGARSNNAVAWLRLKLDSDSKISIGGARPDTTPPSPRKSRWSRKPELLKDDGLSARMTAVKATDSRGVEYFFECLDDSAMSSAWQQERAYSVSGFTPNTSYRFRTRARDGLLNETEWSDTAIVGSGDARKD